VELFAAAREFDMVAALDTACRQNAITRAAELGLAARDCYLFINVCPQTLIHPEHKVGVTNDMAETYGLSKDKIIFEITEETAVQDYKLFCRAIEYYRSQGYKIAIDDFGVGYGGLKMLAAIEPDYVKIDRMFVSGVGQATVRFNLVDSIATACHRLGIKVIAEGVESDADLGIVFDMGIELMQGYGLALPAAELLPKDSQIEFPGGRRAQWFCTNEQYFIGNIAQRVTPVKPHSPMPEVRALFIEHPEAMSLPVVDGERVLGMVQRKKFFEHQVQGRYGYGQALSAYKTAMQLAEDASTTTVEANATLEEVAQKVRVRASGAEYDDVCVTTNGKYLGTVAISALLQSITQRSINLAQGSNPLSGLPGNEMIRREIEKRIAQNMHFDVCYIDIDNFKPFNTFYGFERGDAVIETLAREIENTLADASADHFSFAGHIGGDDFLVMTRPRASLTIAEEIVRRFHVHLRELHGDADFERGCYTTHNRKGTEETFDLLSLSIGVVSAEVHRFSSYAELASLATEVKNAAKAQDGSSIVRDRRVTGEHIDRVPVPLCS
jgi:diguanylate cyclase (GGDEF)-like protein